MQASKVDTSQQNITPEMITELDNQISDLEK
jgi:hypothetical protein